MLGVTENCTNISQRRNIERKDGKRDRNAQFRPPPFGAVERIHCENELMTFTCSDSYVKRSGIHYNDSEGHVCHRNCFHFL